MEIQIGLFFERPYFEYIYEKVPINFYLMKTFLLLLFPVTMHSSVSPITKDCRCKGIPLYGKVKFVNSFPDFKIKYVSHFPDIKVKMVERFANECGKWQVVDNFPDFTVQVVNAFPDFTVRLVENFPGVD
jgi:hypothetical protein